MKLLLRRPLTIAEILAWATAYRETTGKWPTKESGSIAGARFETWLAVDYTLRQGYRGLPGGSSLAKLLAEKYGVRNVQDLPPLSEEQILQWADEHHERTGSWPTSDSGAIFGKRGFGAGAFAGIPLGTWLRVLWENDFAIDLPYWGRAAAITSASIPNSVFRLCEKLIYGRGIRKAKVAAPLFILGIWRSGTTHLHNLFAQDDRFAFPNTYQVFYPHSFLTTELINGKFVQFFMPNTRPQDNVEMGVQEPQEDEFAFCSLTGRSCMLGWAFPRRADHYDRYLTFREASAQEVAEWKSALKGFVQRLAFKYDRPLVLKSPGHTCRIKLLLDLYPDAKFVHIHRNPFEVFQSTLHTVRKVTPWWAMQRPDYHNLIESTIRNYQQVYDVFFEERGLIPEGHFREVCFESLEADPLGQMRAIYEAVDLPDFAFVEPKLKRYLKLLVGYKRNAFTEIPPDQRQRIAKEWRRSFEEWGYSI